MVRRRDQPDDAPDALHGYSAIGNALLRAGPSAEAEPLMRRAADGALSRFGQQHVKTAHYQKNDATSLIMLHRPLEAADQLALAVATERELYPADSPVVVVGINNLAALELMLGHLQRMRLERASTPSSAAALKNLARASTA